MKKISSIICSILAFTFVFVSIPFFTACDGSEKFEKLVTSYDNLVKTNKSIFDENGEVEIKYSSKVDAVINKSNPTIDDKMRLFVRLTRDPNSDQGVYEPVLKASLLYVNRYIHKMDNLNISSGDANKLTDKYNNFGNSLTAFKSQVAYFEDHSENINTTDHTEDNNLVLVLAKMYDLVVSANDFNYTFMQFYEKAVATKEKKGSSKRGTIERFYLRNLAHTCNTYVKVYLPLIHESAPASHGSAELYTEFNFSAFVNKMMSYYLNGRDAIHVFDNKSGELFGNDKNAFNYFLYVTEYELLYQKSCRCMISMDKEWRNAMKEKIEADYDGTNTKKASSSSICKIGFVEDCRADCVIMQDMLNQLVFNISNN